MTTPPPAGDLLTAAGKLRDSREALPDEDRPFPWQSTTTGTYAYVETDRGVAVAKVGHHQHPTAAYIALVASPHVTEALEQLLEEIDDEYTSVLEIRRRARALAAAINHTGRD